MTNLSLLYLEILFLEVLDLTTLKTGSGAAKTVPRYTHCIICGDFNSLSDEDKANLKALAAERGFVLANGGAAEWMPTWQSGENAQCTDNIICSPNVRINSVKTLADRFDDLYSDHIPLLAEVELQ